MATIVELPPVSQGGVSYLPGGVINDGAPPTFGGGSVADGNDSSGVEIGTWYDTSLAASHVEPLVVDFLYDGPDTPIAMGIQVRGATPASALASPPDGARLFWVIYSDPTLAGDPASTFSTGEQSYLTASVFTPFMDTSQATVATVETFWADALERDNPTDAGNWCEIADGGPAGNEMPGAAAALTTTGLRVALYMQQATSGATNPTARIPWLNVYEVRLVVAFETVARPFVPPTRSRPSLRMTQRGGAGGMSGIPRMIGDPTRRGSVRQGPGSVY